MCFAPLRIVLGEVSVKGKEPPRNVDFANSRNILLSVCPSPVLSFVMDRFVQPSYVLPVCPPLLFTAGGSHFQSLCEDMFMILERGHRKREREKNISVREKHQSVPSRVCPHWGSDPQPLVSGTAHSQLSHAAWAGFILIERHLPRD